MSSLNPPRKFSFIDPPSHFAPISEWREFLESLEAEPDKTHQLKEEILKAKEHIAEAEASGDRT